VDDERPVIVELVALGDDDPARELEIFAQKIAKV
jgi:hypothetical protein